MPEDRPLIDAFNQRASPRTRVETTLLPEPFVGRTDAPVILLLLNPGLGGDEFVLHQQAHFRNRVLRCHRQEAAPYPDYYLDPAVTGGGARWRARVTRPLLAEFGPQAVAAGLGWLEYFPYHSRNFAHRRLRVPSQLFAFDLLRAAIRREAVIFVTRGRAAWEEAVPELQAYRRAFRTRSVQNVVISPRNCPDGYEAAQAALRLIADSTALKRPLD